jgi:hypothetical protein
MRITTKIGKNRQKLAFSNFPLLWISAPVNAPFSWPNSSLSKSASGMAPQSMGINGHFDRRLA